MPLPSEFCLSPFPKHSSELFNRRIREINPKEARKHLIQHGGLLRLTGALSPASSEKPPLLTDITLLFVTLAIKKQRLSDWSPCDFSLISAASEWQIAATCENCQKIYFSIFIDLIINEINLGVPDAVMTVPKQQGQSRHDQLACPSATDKIISEK